MLYCGPSVGHSLINLEITGVCLHDLSSCSLICGLHNLVCEIGIIGDDTDLPVLLLYHAEINAHDLFVASEPGI